jgi:hypothetical protein
VLLLGAASTFASSATAERVACTAALIAEDHFNDADSKGYMICSMVNGTTLIFNEVDPAHTAFMTDDRLVLEVELLPPPPLVVEQSEEGSVDVPSLFLSKARTEECTSPSCANQEHKIVQVVDDGGQHRTRRTAVLPTGKRSMLMIRFVKPPPPHLPFNLSIWPSSSLYRRIATHTRTGFTRSLTLGWCTRMQGQTIVTKRVCRM